MIEATFKLEQKLLVQGYDFIIGIDEAGRGPLAGPVVACAVAQRKSQITNHKSQTNHKLQTTNYKPQTNYDSQKDTKYQIPDTKYWDMVRDSKTLSEKQRESVFDFIQENFYIGVGICDHKTVDRINILEASFLAMKKAVSDLSRNLEKTKNQEPRTKNYIILVDGNKKIPNLSMEQKAVVGGDKIVKSISAASIIAKVTRDRLMLSMHEKYPEYGFDKHKGYGTKLHFAMLEKYGPSEIHRQSFEPVRSLVKRQK